MLSVFRFCDYHNRVLKAVELFISKRVAYSGQLQVSDAVSLIETPDESIEQQEYDLGSIPANADKTKTPAKRRLSENSNDGENDAGAQVGGTERGKLQFRRKKCKSVCLPDSNESNPQIDLSISSTASLKKPGKQPRFKYLRNLTTCQSEVHKSNLPPTVRKLLDHRKHSSHPSIGPKVRPHTTEHDVNTHGKRKEKESAETAGNISDMDENSLSDAPSQASSLHDSDISDLSLLQRLHETMKPVSKSATPTKQTISTPDTNVLEKLFSIQAPVFSKTLSPAMCSVESVSKVLFDLNASTSLVKTNTSVRSQSSSHANLVTNAVSLLTCVVSVMNQPHVSIMATSTPPQQSNSAENIPVSVITPPVTLIPFEIMAVDEEESACISTSVIMKNSPTKALMDVVMSPTSSGPASATPLSAGDTPRGDVTHTEIETHLELEPPVQALASFVSEITPTPSLTPTSPPPTSPSPNSCESIILSSDSSSLQRQKATESIHDEGKSVSENEDESGLNDLDKSSSDSNVISLTKDSEVPVDEAVGHASKTVIHSTPPDGFTSAVLPEDDEGDNDEGEEPPELLPKEVPEDFIEHENEFIAAVKGGELRRKRSLAKDSDQEENDNGDKIYKIYKNYEGDNTNVVSENDGDDSNNTNDNADNDVDNFSDEGNDSNVGDSSMDVDSNKSSSEKSGSSKTTTIPMKSITGPSLDVETITTLFCFKGPVVSNSPNRSLDEAAAISKGLVENISIKTHVKTSDCIPVILEPLNRLSPQTPSLLSDDDSYATSHEQVQSESDTPDTNETNRLSNTNKLSKNDAASSVCNLTNSMNSTKATNSTSDKTQDFFTPNSSTNQLISSVSSLSTSETPKQSTLNDTNNESYLSITNTFPTTRGDLSVIEKTDDVCFHSVLSDKQATECSDMSFDESYADVNSTSEHFQSLASDDDEVCPVSGTAAAVNCSVNMTKADLDAPNIIHHTDSISSDDDEEEEEKKSEVSDAGKSKKSSNLAY